MSLIAGVGDEVIQFMITVMVIVIASLAWWSTNSRPDRYRTVLLMRSRLTHPVTVSIRTRPLLPARPRPRTHITPLASEPIITTTTSTSNSSDGNHLIPIQEMDSIVDADMAMLDNNRLHFYRVVDATPSTSQITLETNVIETETHEDLEPASEAQIREMDSIVSAMEADVPLQHERNITEVPATSTIKEPIPNTSSPVVEAEGTSSESAEVDTSNKILIKLKYLNETLKEVEGSLDELLKDFKGRHFAAELSSESRVRLIFNGRVLVDEAATLRACGLHHQAVVHALIHPKRNAPSQPNPTEPATPGQTVVTEAPAAERSWDLENILILVLQRPHGNLNIFYYKRKFSSFNFTVFDMGKRKAVCYIWDESVAKRGSNEVRSCLLDFIQANVDRGVKEFRYWSDNCAGQNRNCFVFLMYVYAAEKFNICIIHCFLQKGHTQNEGDSDCDTKCHASFNFTPKKVLAIFT